MAIFDRVCGSRRYSSFATVAGQVKSIASFSAAVLVGCSSGGTSPGTSSNSEQTTGTSSSTSSSTPTPGGATSNTQSVPPTSPSVTSPATNPSPSSQITTSSPSPTTVETTATSSGTLDATGDFGPSFTSDAASAPATGSEGRSDTNDADSTAPDAEAATVVPDASWACGAAEGLPPPELGELVFEATLDLGETHEFGETPYGTRRLLDVTGATFTGERISGSFLTGGLELELLLSNGNLELEQIDILRTDDNALIYLRTCGFAPNGATTSRFVPDFEAPNSSAYTWLNTGKFAGTRVVDEAGQTVRLAIYDISDVTLPDPKVQLQDPAGVPHQPWDCATTGGSRGATVFTETVTLGQSLSVGASKRGTRNIIPITGGTVTGRLTGSVVPGGADYQLIGASTVLDARYSLVGNDGEYVLVRNCGPFGALIPQFEARKDGPYAFLNENRYLSSDPGSAGGGVSITFYEAD